MKIYLEIVPGCSYISNILQVSNSDASCQTSFYLTNKIVRKIKLIKKVQTKNYEIKNLKKKLNAVTQ